MKIVTWNCNGAFRKKRQIIEELKADLLIIQECEDPAQSTHEYREWAGVHLWHGDSKNKGIGIFSRGGIPLERLKWNDDNLQSFLPCKVDGDFNLLAVWTKYANSPNFRYIGQLWKYIQINREKIAKEKIVICGDFNSNVCWDEWDRWWNHSDVVKELKQIGIYSVYHRYFAEEQGKESKATLFHQRNKSKPYHVDYAFSSKSMFQENKNYVNVGRPEEWLMLSDHMPIEFTINS